MYTYNIAMVCKLLQPFNHLGVEYAIVPPRPDIRTHSIKGRSTQEVKMHEVGGGEFFFLRAMKEGFINVEHHERRRHWMLHERPSQCSGKLRKNTHHSSVNQIDKPSKA